MKTASWVICSKATGKAVMETFNEKTALAINKEKYEAIPIYQYLVNLNKEIKNGK